MSEHFFKGRSTKPLALSSFDVTYIIRNSIRIIFCGLILFTFQTNNVIPILSRALSYPPATRRQKPFIPKSQNPSFRTQICSSTLPTSPGKSLHLSSPHLSPGIIFFPDTLCYPEIEDSVNAELLSSNYNTQNIVSLWDSRCKGRERSAGTQSCDVPCSVPLEIAGMDAAPLLSLFLSCPGRVSL